MNSEREDSVAHTPADGAAEGPNAAQRDYWSTSPGAEAWTSLHRDLDLQFVPLTAAALEVLAPGPGEKILDVGCGCGDTALRIAARVAPGGSVTGLDISAAMLAVARQRAAAQGVAGVDFVEADAQTHAFAEGAYDAVFSRFGVMFFADPVAAFANLCRALRAGGRLAFLCWRDPADNPFMTAPLEAALHLFPEPPPPADPLAPGPFAFADPARVEGILKDAGFAAIALAPLDLPAGGHPLDRALHLALSVGPLSRLLREQPDLREQAREAVRAALAAHDGPDGVRLRTATWLVSARK